MKHKLSWQISRTPSIQRSTGRFNCDKTSSTDRVIIVIIQIAREGLLEGNCRQFHEIFTSQSIASRQNLFFSHNFWWAVTMAGRRDQSWSEIFEGTEKFQDFDTLIKLLRSPLV